MTPPAPPVTRIQTVYTIQPHEIACWLSVVRQYLDAAATLAAFNGYGRVDRLYCALSPCSHADCPAHLEL
jgi:hypothetical protein